MVLLYTKNACSLFDNKLINAIVNVKASKPKLTWKDDVKSALSKRELGVKNTRVSVQHRNV